MGNLPNLIIFGIAKCGTSAIHDYLDLHPQITMSKIKELSFFNSNRAWKRGINWYESNWPIRNDILGESSPSYTEDADWQEVPERIAHTLTDVKLIYMVRDPIDRIRSHYANAYRKHLENRTFQEAIFSDPKNLFIDLSKYYKKILPFWNLFGQQSIYIVDLWDLKTNPRETMQGVFRFLNVEDSFYSPKFERSINNSSVKKREINIITALRHFKNNTILSKIHFPLFLHKVNKIFFKRAVRLPELQSAERKILARYLEEDIQKFRELSGKNFNHWSV
ncbi:MAG: sulfotransferase [Desulfobacterales bacterium]|nr:sulfotransferase [Desulfobacterales bacterium]